MTRQHTTKEQKHVRRRDPGSSIPPHKDIFKLPKDNQLVYDIDIPNIWVENPTFRIGSDINYVYIGTHLDLNLYVVYHETHKKLFVIFRGTNSDMSVKEDLNTMMTRISNNDLKSSQYYSTDWQKKTKYSVRRGQIYYTKNGVKAELPDNEEQDVYELRDDSNVAGEEDWTTGGLGQ